jgi:hypothetical protein
MRGYALRAAVTVAFAASLAAAAGAPSSARPTAVPAAQEARQQPRSPVLVDCLWHPKMRPASFILACGDGNSRLVSLHWSQWNAHTAKAEGVNLVNDCNPYCARGRFHPYRVLVRLDHVKPWKKHPRLPHYGRMTLTYEGNRPAHFARTVTYPLWE